AKVVGLHPNYALSLFGEVMRVPMHKFVVRMRLIRARHLLFEGNLSIEDVAYESGFSALSQFYVQFRNAYGLTPRQMRAHYLRRPVLGLRPAKRFGILVTRTSGLKPASARVRLSLFMQRRVHCVA